MNRSARRALARTSAKELYRMQWHLQALKDRHDELMAAGLISEAAKLRERINKKIAKLNEEYK